MITDDLYTIDWIKAYPETLEKLSTGQGRILNGVARDVFDGNKIIQHMPFTKVSIQQSGDLIKTAQLVQSAQAAITSAIAISTAVTVGAIVVSTMYLANKIDKLQEKMDLLHKEINDQNILFYLEKVTIYFGTVESLRQLILNSDVVAENKDIINNVLSELLIIRNQTLSFIDNIIYLSDRFSPGHKNLVLDFINLSLELIPKGLFIESQTAYKLDRFHLGDNIKEVGRAKYNNVLNKYKDWGNKQYKSIVKGESNSGTQGLLKNIDNIKSILHSEENKLLLEHSI